MENTKNSGAGYIASIDSLRAIAVIFVVVEHSNAALFMRGWKDGTFFGLCNFGIGVELFFVISGFVVFLNLQQSWSELKTDFFGFWRHFLIRRFFRLAPACFLWLGIILLLSRVIPAHMAWNPEAVLREALGIATYTYNFLVAYNIFVIPGSSLGYHYSLAIEEQFYLILPLVLLVTNRKKLFILCISVLLLAHLISRPVEWYYFRYDSFCWGILAAFAYLRLKNWKRFEGVSWRLILGSIAWLALVSLPIAQFIPGASTPFEWPAAISLIAVLSVSLGAAIFPSKKIDAVFQSIGHFSYSAYLSHLPIIMLFNAAIIAAGWSDQNAQNQISSPTLRLSINFLMLFSIWLASKLSYRYVETPMRRIGRNMTGKTRYQSGGGIRGYSQAGNEAQ